MELAQPPLPPGPLPPLPPFSYDQQPPNGFAAQQQAAYDLPQQQLQSSRRKKRGKRGSGLETRHRGFKPRPTQQLGFFSSSQVPSLQDLRQENFRRTQQHYGPPRLPFPPQPAPAGQLKPHGTPLSMGWLPPAGAAARLHPAGHPSIPPSRRFPNNTGPGRTGGHRRSRGGKAAKASKLPKFPAAPTPRPMPLTPAAGNPLDTPANAGVAAAAAPSGMDRLEAEGLQAGLDWYGTNENAAALFLTGQQATTSDSELDDGGDDFEGSDADAHSGGGGSGDGGSGGGTAAGDAYAEGALPRGIKARLVEQEAYIAELEDQNLRLREQLELVQQEVEELRGIRRPADSEEGFAEHSEGSLPADHSVMNHH